MLHLYAPDSRLARCCKGVFVAALAALATMPASVAQETVLQQYEVELVIFRVTNPTATPEDWAMEASRAKVGLPTARETDEPADATATSPAAPAVSPVVTPVVTPVTTLGSETSIQPLESGRHKLTAIEGALKRSRSYQPLAHIGWSQPGFGRTNPRPLGIETLVTSASGITGTVTLTRGTRLLHLGLDLTYQAPDGQRYVLREQRPMRRSGEKHYFDHPHFGVIALVTPKG